MNLKSLLLTVGVLVINSANAAELNPRFVKAIHQVESSGRVGKIVGDNGKALGPLQIHREYFQDAVEYDPSLGRNYNQVTNLAFAKRVVSAYLNRYVPKAVSSNNFQVLARVHNGGPAGHKNPKTIKYWAKVEKNLN